MKWTKIQRDKRFGVDFISAQTPIGIARIEIGASTGPDNTFHRVFIGKRYISMSAESIKQAKWHVESEILTTLEQLQEFVAQHNLTKTNGTDQHKG